MIPVDEWVRTCIERTSRHEGQPWSTQANLDGHGLSWGILQWTQRGGGLGELLAAMYRADAAQFAAVFGPHFRELLAVTAAASLAPVGGQLLWAPYWLERFQRAGRLAVFQDVQVERAATSAYMAGAVRIARRFAVHTERAMVVYYNRTVHQGAGSAMKVADRLATWYDEHPDQRPSCEHHLLAQYGWFCAAKFRRATPPSGPLSSTTPWVEVTAKGTEPELALLADGTVRLEDRPLRGRVWHAWAGGKEYFDLWNLIIRRTAEILADPGLRDQPALLP